MKPQKYLLTILFALSFLASTATIASAKTGDFQAIDQPLPLKLAITVIGTGLIALELWWFLLKWPSRD